MQRKTITKELVLKRYTRAELNKRRVVGLTLVSVLIGSVAGCNTRNVDCSKCYPNFENCPKQCPLG